MIAPLNEAILESEDGKATPVSQLVQGLPKELAKSTASATWGEQARSLSDKKIRGLGSGQDSRGQK
jgi:ABC-type thiamin/hydroxymethylpyrimidine transport system permease subunit